ncbi:MAG: hypothetical protein AVDCRST_MAG85-3221 [uncultured Solirubrobacteraceae bacterium]|uniref:Uncharacterized protein n=1 Tax=uncultured Solirubrobacteraceae bacterium TaxID=1162706 RepID=A0A6J4TKF2_9ACTN|nr:MAG: hypothetical protein AVDCRST_MAG85-3221 [uncultured Solirubrobacteraceae bacterium]
MRRALRRSCLVLLVCLGASPAPAAGQDGITLTTSTWIDALDGWVAFNRNVGDNVKPVAWRNGRERVLPAAGAGKARNFDLGTDANGRTVMAYERCSDELAGVYTRCHIRVIDLAANTDRAAGIRRPRGASDHSPSMWRGRIAFARTPRGEGHDRVLLWSPTTGRTTALPRGPVGSCPPDCGSLRSARAYDLDLGPSLVAYVWDANFTSEVWVHRLPGGRPIRLSDNPIGARDGCRGTIEFNPTVQGSVVWWGTYGQFCDGGRIPAYVIRVSLAERSMRATTFAGPIGGFARDGARSYAVVGSIFDSLSGPICAPETPCTVRRVDSPRP